VRFVDPWKFVDDFPVSEKNNPNEKYATIINPNIAMTTITGLVL